MTGLIAGCWKVSKNLQKELKEEMETIGEAEKSDRIVVLDMVVLIQGRSESME